ncbi:hypothetical protein YC2023_075807 [Brassica napus]
MEGHFNVEHMCGWMFLDEDYNLLGLLTTLSSFVARSNQSSRNLSERTNNTDRRPFQRETYVWVARLAKDLVGQLSCSRVRRQAVANCPSCHPHGYGPLLSGPFEYPERESIRGLHFPLGISLGHKGLGYPQKIHIQENHHKLIINISVCECVTQQWRRGRRQEFPCQHMVSREGLFS